MKSEEIIQIELRDPILCKIRKNLRDIIKLAVESEIER